MTMSDDGDKSCPLCAEEMDLTDLQLKPCKCGYEICVWCWHHILEMAEKVGTDGRCPACRCSYDKEKIVGMAANCERLLVGMNVDRRPKIQKGKSKASAETRKQLSSVRVIQRNLVYIIGLPVNLCDENLLEGMEYFGRYGNVLKVSISRPSSTTNQHTSCTSNFGVYINYATEEEAVRCIQAVNNFILDGKPLRACFGTTKYCHAWLRNMNCSNPDCLYLHDIGSQEDSFSKDEIISAFSRVPKIVTSSSQRRAGNSLPSPADEFSINGSTSNKNIVRNTSDNAAGHVKVLNGSIGKHTVLPAAASWGSRSSLKQNFDSNNSSTACSSVKAVIKQASSAWHDNLHPSEIDEKPVLIVNGTSSPSEHQPRKGRMLNGLGSTESDLPDPRDSAWDDTPYIRSNFLAIDDFKLSLQKVSVDCTKKLAAGTGLPLDFTTVEMDQVSDSSSSSIFSSVLEENSSDSLKDTWNDINTDNGMTTESLEFLSVASEISELKCNYANVNQDIENNVHHGSILDSILINPSSSSQELFRGCVEKSIFSEERDSIKPSGWNSESGQIFQSLGDRLECLSLPTSDVSLRFPEVSTQRLSLSQLDHSLHCVDSLCTDEVKGLNSLRQNVDKIACKQYDDKYRNIYRSEGTVDSPHLSFNKGLVHLDKFNSIDKSDKCSNLHTKENSIISDILSLDFDPWEDSQSIENNLSKLLGSKPLNTQSSNQSRFSFARQENQTSFNMPSISSIDQMGKALSVNTSYEDDFKGNISFGNTSMKNIMTVSSDRPGGVSRAKLSAPPGFSMPSRAPPPGFAAQDHHGQNLKIASDAHRLIHQTESSGDVEFIDPAILAVGKGLMPVRSGGNAAFSFGSVSPAQFSSSECDPRHHQLLQHCGSSFQSMKFPNHSRDTILPAGDSYISSCILAQNRNISSSLAKLPLQQSRIAPILSSHWDGLNSNVQTNNSMGMNDFLRNQRLGLNEYYIGSGEGMLHIPSSNDIYGRAFGI